MRLNFAGIGIGVLLGFLLSISIDFGVLFGFVLSNLIDCPGLLDFRLLLGFSLGIAFTAILAIGFLPPVSFFIAMLLALLV